MYEITFVEDMIPFFQLGKNYVWQMETSLFRYGQEDLSTGITEVDAVESQADTFTQSTDIETDADSGIVDFTESNPFGTF